MVPSDAYRDDLAYIHDAGYGDIARDAAARLVEELAACGRSGGTVVDLGCGSGILASALLSAGYHVVGIDVSEAMLAMARTRAPGAEFRVGSFLSADLPASVAVTAVGEVVNYTFDSTNDESARTDLFRRIYHALVPGGVFLFDVAGPDRAKPGESQRAYAEGPEWAVLVETRVEQGMLTRKITTFRQVGSLHRRDSEEHRLVLVDPTTVLRSLQDAGFEVRMMRAYGAVPLPAGIVAFRARKPETGQTHVEPGELGPDRATLVSLR